MHGVLDGYVERGEVPGAVALVARKSGLHVQRAARAQQEFASDDLETAQAA
jgi:hypothetical protein